MLNSTCIHVLKVTETPAAFSRLAAVGQWPAMADGEIFLGGRTVAVFGTGMADYRVRPPKELIWWT